MDPYVAGPANEGDLIREVRHNLLMLPYYGVFDDLGFNVNGSTVTLTGQVSNPALKDDAGSAVKKLKDVSNVVNNIEVLPLSPDDNNLRVAVYRAIYNDPSLSVRYGYRAAPPIHIIVKNGHRAPRRSSLQPGRIRTGLACSVHSGSRRKHTPLRTIYRCSK